VAIEGVEPTEYAIIRNNLSQDVNQNEILEGGLHWVGVFYSLVHFPAIHKSIEFSDEHTVGAQKVQPRLSTRTKEGLELDISFAFQYQIMKDQLPMMYRMCQEEYDAIYTKIARNAVLQVAGDWNASDYWLNRTVIGQNMKESL
jgi:hypothetical protein